MMTWLQKIARGGVSEAQLSAYVDGALAEYARARIQGIEDGAPALRARRAGLQATVEALRSADVITAPRSFALSPATAYGRASPIHGRGLSPLVPAVAAAAAALAVGVLLIGNATGSLTQTPKRTASTSAVAAEAGAEAPALGAQASVAAPLPEGAFGIAAAGEARDLSAGAIAEVIADAETSAPEGVRIDGARVFDTVTTQVRPVAAGDAAGAGIKPAGFELPLWQLVLGLAILALALAGVAGVTAIRRSRSLRFR
jgi:hypothetical protein